ncbi:sigma-54-dependent Fis family transcriptional regulator [Sesbania bispinosa]|nr:sigma-54-dependent Fis family transcriptional regulator [Sesbania bispinosa]
MHMTKTAAETIHASCAGDGDGWESDEDASVAIVAASDLQRRGTTILNGNKRRPSPIASDFSRRHGSCDSLLFDMSLKLGHLDEQNGEGWFS